MDPFDKEITFLAPVVYSVDSELQFFFIRDTFYHFIFTGEHIQNYFDSDHTSHVLHQIIQS